jgi:hypothetical protein
VGDARPSSPADFVAPDRINDELSPMTFNNDDTVSFNGNCFAIKKNKHNFLLKKEDQE